MTTLLKTLTLALTLFAAPLAAELARPSVLVELYTAQGCRNCPPADEMMHHLAKDDDILALSLHVDYWDYLGWKDEFARPDHAERQKAYVSLQGKHMVFTPHFVVNGREHFGGMDETSLKDGIARMAAAQKYPVSVSVEDGVLTLTGQLPEAVHVEFVEFLPLAKSEIRGGENAGRSVEYVNTVTRFERLETWSGAGALTLPFTRTPERGAAVILQSDGPALVYGVFLLPAR